MNQIELDLPGVTSQRPDIAEKALFVGTYRSLFDFVTQGARKGLGSVVLGYPQQGMGTFLKGIGRNLSEDARVFSYRCCPEANYFNQIASFTNALAPNMSFKSAKESHAEHLAICAHRIVTIDELRYLVIHRIDLASDTMMEFIEGILELCADYGRKLVPIIGQRVTNSEDPVRFQASGSMPLKVVMPTVDGRTAGQFIAVYCSGGKTFSDAITAGDAATTKMLGRIVDYSDGLLSKVVQFCTIKEALVPGIPLTADVMEACLKYLKNPMEAMELLAAINRKDMRR